MGGFLPVTALVFWSAVGLKLNDDVHRKSNHRTGLFLMLQALPSADRIRTQTLMEGVFGSLIGGLAGVLLLLLNRWSPLAAPWALVLIAVAWTAWTLTVRKPYLETVAGSLRRQLVLSNTTQMLDATSRALLRAYLQGNDPALILYAMHCLEQSELDPVDLEKLLHHELPDIRMEAARLMARHALLAELPIIEGRIRVEADPRVLAELIQAALAMAPDAGLGIARQHLNAPDVQVRRFALTGVFKQGLAAADAMAALRHLAESPDPNERLAAMKVMEDSSTDTMIPHLLRGLDDPVPTVRRGAARAAAPFTDFDVARKLVALLHDPECQQDSIVALRNDGAPAVRLILEEWNRREHSRFGRRGLVRALGQVECPEARDALWQLLSDANLHVRGLILEVLAGHPEALSDARTNQLRNLFREDVAASAKARNLLRLLPSDDPRCHLLAASVAEDRKTALRRALDAVTLLYPGTSFAMAKPYLLEPSGNRLGLALETVDNLFSLEDRAVLIPALTDDQGPNQSAPATTPRKATADALRDLTNPEVDFLSPFTQLLASRCLAAPDQGSIPHPDAVPPPLLQAVSRTSGLLPDIHADEMEEILRRLAVFHGLDFFSGVALSSLAQVVRKCSAHEFARGACLINLGDPGHSLFVITQGHVRVHREESTIAELHAGSIVGEMSAIDPEPRIASVTALDPVSALELDRTTLLELMREHFDLSRAVMKMLATRLRHVCAQDQD